jgi:acyl-coenzyme A thioesterase PaaI-like protein
MHIPRWIRHLPFLGAARRLAWYPPFRAMSIEVVSLGDDWRSVRIRLPLNRFNRNPGGSMFGGAVAALADPIPALSCNRVFPGHQLWTRRLQLEFVREGRSDLQLRFDLDAAQEQAIREELQTRGRATPTFEFGFYDTQDRLCVKVLNSVAIRPIGYRPQGEST